MEGIFVWQEVQNARNVAYKFFVSFLKNQIWAIKERFPKIIIYKYK